MSKQQKAIHGLFPKVGKVCVGLLMAAASMTSCSDMESYFESPSWLRGSIFETLTSDGNYTQFLAGAEKAGYTPILQGNSILTVMAPDDGQMNSYLQTNYGTTDISTLSQQELKKLIGFHIFYYSFGKDNLINFRPKEGDGATEEQLLTNAGLYYKFRTRSQDPVSIERDTFSIEQPDGTYKDSIGTEKSVYHLERYCPVYSYMMFRTKVIDPAENYNYFYGDGAWKDNSGFNVSNAGVDEYAVATSNGYIYRIDQVLKPLETIYKELSSRSEYSRYLKMFNNYRTYTYNEDLTQSYGNGTNLYQIEHTGLAPIALEWPVTDYTKVTDLASKSYSVFAFTNTAFEEFFNDYWGKGGYTSPDDPDLSDALQDLLRNSFYSQDLVFPQEITEKKIKNPNNSNEPFYFDVTKVKQEDRVMCANGVLYGCSELTPPSKYGSVTGPAFQFKKYSYFLNMLNASGLQSTLSSDAVDYIMLYPTDDQMNKKYGFELTKLKETDTQRTLISTDAPTGVSSQTKSAAIYAHVAQPIDGNTILPTTGKKVLRALTSDQILYWYVKDGKITTSIKLNDLMKYAANVNTEDSVWATFDFIPYRGNNDGWTNGHAYQYDNLFFYGADNDHPTAFFNLMYTQSTDATTDFYGWYQLLRTIGMINSAGKMVDDNFDSSEKYIMLVPKTLALEEAIVAGKLPGISATGGAGQADFFAKNEDGTYQYITVTDANALKQYLRSYFVPMSTANVSEYPFVGWGEDTSSKGGMQTIDMDTEGDGDDIQTISSNINIYDNGSRLSVSRVNRLKKESSAKVLISDDYDTFPFTFSDGCVQFLEDVLPLVDGI